MVEGDVLEVFVESYSSDGVSCRCSESKHKIWYGSQTGVDDSRPPACRCNCAISRVWWGRVGQLMSSEMNFVMIWFVAEVKGPFQSVHVGGGLFMS